MVGSPEAASRFDEMEIKNKRNYIIEDIEKKRKKQASSSHVFRRRSTNTIMI